MANPRSLTARVTRAPSIALIPIATIIGSYYLTKSNPMWVGPVVFVGTSLTFTEVLRDTLGSTPDASLNAKRDVIKEYTEVIGPIMLHYVYPIY